MRGKDIVRLRELAKDLELYTMLGDDALRLITNDLGH
jgi:hypothetical protein